VNLPIKASLVLAQGGAEMAKPILDDALWEIIEPLLPPPKRRRKRYPGRKPIDNRKALCAILFVLRTGIPWESLPQELGWGSGMTAWRRLHAWQRRGVWQKIHAALLAHLQEADVIDWSRAIVDSSSVRAVHGGKKRARIPRIAAKLAASII
jgi:transposase